MIKAPGTLIQTNMTEKPPKHHKPAGITISPVDC